jgi:methyl coenzyme M reductase subunit D
MITDSSPERIKAITSVITESRAGSIKINMDQFRKKWKTYSDNVKYAETIRATNGDFYSHDLDGVVHWLNEFNIFYTLTESSN